MPRLDFGQQAHFDRKSTEFLELKNKGDIVTIRFLASPVYEGKHFQQNSDSSWTVTTCPRIMKEEQCSLCEKYFETKKVMKEMGDPDSLDGEDKKTYSTLENLARKNKVVLNFYYPVLDRENEVGAIFKCGLSIRGELDKESSAGIPIIEYDYVIKRLKSKVGDAGKDFYSFTRLDSKMIKPLTDKENDEITKILDVDLEKLIGGKESHQSIE